MDQLHREHEFVQKMWKFIKTARLWGDRDDNFWNWQQDTAELIASQYSDVPFAYDWLLSFQKSLEK